MNYIYIMYLLYVCVHSVYIVLKTPGGGISFCFILKHPGIQFMSSGMDVRLQ